MIPLTVPEVGDEEIAAVARVLRSGCLVQGAEVLAFEQALAAYTGRAHALAVSSGTAALELALRALGVSRGDEVLCPALTWPSPAHVIRMLGAVPVLVDIDPQEWNVTPRALAQAVTPRTRAAIVIEQFGNPARHDAIASALGSIPVVVDAACSLGSRYRGAPCGRHGVISCTSFHPRKVITTGEGGACFTDDPDLDRQLRGLRNHGQVEPGRFAFASGNHRLTDFAAAMGRVQLQKLDDACRARLRWFARIRGALPGLGFQVTPEHGVENRQTLGVLVGPVGTGSAARDAAIAGLAARGVQASRLSYALAELPHLRPEREQAAQRGRSLAVASDVAQRGLALPLYPSMSEQVVAQVIEAVKEVVMQADEAHD